MRTNLVKRCGDSNHGNRLITNGAQILKILSTFAFISCHIYFCHIFHCQALLQEIFAIHCCHFMFAGVYFIFRMLATMALASCFILLDAQTIQMCTSEKNGSIKRRIPKNLRQFQNWFEQKFLASWGEAGPHWQLWKADPLQNSCSGLKICRKIIIPYQTHQESLSTNDVRECKSSCCHNDYFFDRPSSLQVLAR